MGSAPRDPHPGEMLEAISNASRAEGSATPWAIARWLERLMGERPSDAQVRAALNSLLSADLIVRDARRSQGGSYGLTFKGKQKLAGSGDR
jgi:hypothetical protein